MAYSLLVKAASPSTTNTAMYTVPAGSTALITNLTAENSTAGALNLWVNVKENDSGNLTTHIVRNNPIAAGTVSYYGRGSSVAACPFTMLAGQILQASASGNGINVKVSGLLLS